MNTQEGVFENGSPDVTASDVIANLLGWGKLPLLLAVQRRNSNTARNIDGLGNVSNILERSLNTVVDTVEQARAELDRQGFTRSDDRVTDLDTS